MVSVSQTCTQSILHDGALGCYAPGHTCPHILSLEGAAKKQVVVRTDIPCVALYRYLEWHILSVGFLAELTSP